VLVDDHDRALLASADQNLKRLEQPSRGPRIRASRAVHRRTRAKPKVGSPKDPVRLRPAVPKVRRRRPVTYGLLKLWTGNSLRSGGPGNAWSPSSPTAGISRLWAKR